MATKPKPKASPKKPTPAKKDAPAKRGKAKKVASAASVDGAGGAFENRVQAVKLLGLVLETATLGVPKSSRIVRLQFQARVHGSHIAYEAPVEENSRKFTKLKSGNLYC